MIVKWMWIGFRLYLNPMKWDESLWKKKQDLGECFVFVLGKINIWDIIISDYNGLRGGSYIICS